MRSYIHQKTSYILSSLAMFIIQVRKPRLRGPWTFLSISQLTSDRAKIEHRHSILVSQASARHSRTQATPWCFPEVARAESWICEAELGLQLKHPGLWDAGNPSGISNHLPECTKTQSEKCSHVCVVVTSVPWECSTHTDHLPRSSSTFSRHILLSASPCVLNDFANLFRHPSSAQITIYFIPPLPLGILLHIIFHHNKQCFEGCPCT